MKLKKVKVISTRNAVANLSTADVMFQCGEIILNTVGLKVNRIQLHLILNLRRLANEIIEV